MKRFVIPVLAQFIILSLLVMASSDSFAKNLKWEDFTKPYRLEFKVAPSRQVEVVIPEYILKEYKEVELIITSDGLGTRSYGIVLKGLLTINGASSWKGYTINGNNNSIDRALNTIMIATKNLKPGLNKLKFATKEMNLYSRQGYKITELRFNIPNIEEIQARYRKDTSPSASQVKKPAEKMMTVRKKEQLPVTPQKQVEPKPQVAQNQVVKKNPSTALNKQKAQVSEKNKASQKRREKDQPAGVKSLEASFSKKTRIYLQHGLQQLGHYRGQVDGTFGPGTRKSIKAYQKSQGKPTTGYLEKTDITTLVALGRVVYEKAEVERQFREKEAQRLAEEQAERKRKEAEAQRLAEEKAERERKEAEARRLAEEKAERERKEAETRRLALEAEERKRQEEESLRIAREEAEHKKRQADTHRKFEAQAKQKSKAEEARRIAEAEAQRKQQEEDSRRLAEQRATAQREAEKERQSLKLKLKEELKAELQDQLIIELEKKKRQEARHSAGSDSSIKFAGPSVTFSTLYAEVGCGSQDSATVQNEKFSRRYKDRIFVLTGQIIAVKESRVLMDFDDGSADIEIDLIPGQDNKALKQKIATVEFVMKKKGGCFSLFYGDRGIVNEVKGDKDLISHHRNNN